MVTLSNAFCTRTADTSDISLNKRMTRLCSHLFIMFGLKSDRRRLMKAAICLNMGKTSCCLSPRGTALYNKSSAVAEMGDRGHNRHGPKRGRGCCAPFTGAAGSPSNTMWPELRSTSVPSGTLIHPAVEATIGMGRKFGGSAPCLVRGSWVPI